MPLFLFKKGMGRRRPGIDPWARRPAFWWCKTFFVEKEGIIVVVMILNTKKSVLRIFYFKDRWSSDIF